MPGTDLVVLLALLHVVLAEGLADAATSRSARTGLDAVRRSVARGGPSEPSASAGPPPRRCGTPPAGRGRPSRGGAGAFILTGRGVEQSSQGTATVTAAINLALALGLPGRPGSG